jgi:hypothetical protein
MLHSDSEACFYVLQGRDFGYIREPLSFVRTHEGSMSSTVAFKYNTHLLDNLAILSRYGPSLLTPLELDARSDFLMGRYYRFLLKNLACLRGREFLSYQFNWLRTSGQPLRPLQLFRAVFSLTWRLATHPQRLFVRLGSGIRRLQSRLGAQRPELSKKTSV